jgi:hypothetical protein
MGKYKNEIQKVAGTWTAWAFNSQAASLLNQRLRTYQLEPGQTWGEQEGVFKFAESELPFVRAVLEKWGGLERTQAQD